MSIIRVDRSAMRLHGWLVSVNFLGVTNRRFFSDRRYGSSKAAHSKARQLNDLLSAYAREVLALGRRLHVRTTTRFGTPGVTLVTRTAAEPHWVAYWIDDDGRRVQRRFSISRHGPGAAMQLALQARSRFAARDAQRLARIMSEVAELLETAPSAEKR
jgi:hypothetical protein